MTKQEVWDLLSHLTVGTVVAWIIVIAAIVTVIVLGCKRLYGWFQKYHTYTTEKEKTAKRLQRHDEILDDIVSRLEKLDQCYNQTNRVLIQSIRHDIVVACLAAIEAGQITAIQLHELDDLYEEYDKYGGNSYASTLMQKVHKLPVI